MLRGSTDLLQRSVRYLGPLIEAIAGSPSELWQIDADDYGDEIWATLEQFDTQLRCALSEKASHTLVTKILLGVFGCVPAFDANFMRGAGVWSFNRSSLQRVGSFYHEHAETIERYRVPTLDFATGASTERRYTRAKVIDMVFFVEGAS